MTYSNLGAFVVILFYQVLMWEMHHIMDDVINCKCSAKIPQLMNKLDENGVDRKVIKCITDHPLPQSRQHTVGDVQHYGV